MKIAALLTVVALACGTALAAQTSSTAERDSAAPSRRSVALPALVERSSRFVVDMGGLPAEQAVLVRPLRTWQDLTRTARRFIPPE